VSPLGDYLGRRSVLLGSFALVALSTLMGSTADTPQELLNWRLLTGLGLGASLPNALAMGAEYAPARTRTALVALLACCISLGSAVSGLAAPWILAVGSWRTLFVVGGSVALLAWLPLLALPESARLLPTGKLSVGYLLTPNLAPATLLLWLVFFLNLGLLYVMSVWLSTLLNQSGLPLPQALRIGAMFQIGGVAGGFGLAWLMQRWGPFLVLAASYALTAGALALLGTHVTEPALLVVLILIIGNGINGGQVALNAVSATLYPTAVRATGVGWALGIGRLGAILGPLAAGSLMSAGIPLGHLFWLAIIPTLTSAIAVVLLRGAVSRSTAASLAAAADANAPRV
jgi:AAHS family 4-hydroxybenzoate transporter-like MFS transporter